MDYSSFKNSTGVLDQSAWQQACFVLAYLDVDVYKFLSSQNIEVVATVNSAVELTYQAYNQNLFGVSLTASEFNSKQSYVLSSTNGSMTNKDFDFNGFPVGITQDLKYKKFTKTLWNGTPYFKKLSDADKSNIYLGRYLQKIKRNFFIFSNDKNQIKQANLEGFKYLKPKNLFSWMVTEGFINKQKLFWIFKKIEEQYD